MKIKGAENYLKDRYCSSVIADKFLLVADPNYAPYIEKRLWDNFKDPIIDELKKNESIIIEKIFDVQRDLFEYNQIEKRQDILIRKLIPCRFCGHNINAPDPDGANVNCELFREMDDPDGYCYKAMSCEVEE